MHLGGGLGPVEAYPVSDIKKELTAKLKKLNLKLHCNQNETIFNGRTVELWPRSPRLELRALRTELLQPRTTVEKATPRSVRKG